MKATKVGVVFTNSKNKSIYSYIAPHNIQVGDTVELPKGEWQIVDDLFQPVPSPNPTGKVVSILSKDKMASKSIIRIIRARIPGGIREVHDL